MSETTTAPCPKCGKQFGNCFECSTAQTTAERLREIDERSKVIKPNTTWYFEVQTLWLRDKLRELAHIARERHTINCFCAGCEEARDILEADE